MIGAWRAIFDGGPALVVDGKLVARRAFRAQITFVDGRIRIAFDIDDLVVDGVSDHAAADGAIRTDRRNGLGVLDAQGSGVRYGRGEAHAERAECADRGRDAA